MTALGQLWRSARRLLPVGRRVSAPGPKPNEGPASVVASVAASGVAHSSYYQNADGETLFMAAPAAPLPGMMALLDLGQLCTAASPSLARWLDSDRDLMRGQGLPQMFGASTAEVLAPQVQAALAGSMRRLRCLHVGANGTERWLQVELQPLTDEYGECIGCTLLAMDVTPEQRQLMSSLRSERRLRFMLDQVPAAVAYIDTHLNYRHINRGQARWLGLADSEVIGMPLRDLVGEAAWSAMAPGLMAALRGEPQAAAAQPAPDTTAGATAGATDRSPDSTASRMPEATAPGRRGDLADDGADDPTTPTAADSSADPWADPSSDPDADPMADPMSDLQATSQRPGSRPRGRFTPDIGSDGKVLGVCAVFELGPWALTPAAEAAARAAQRPGAEHRAAHPTQALMSVEPGQAELLVDTQPSALDDGLRGPSLAEALRRPGQSLLAVINDVLDHAQIEAGELAPEQADYDLRNLVEEVVEQLAPQAQTRPIELSCRIDEGLPATLQGDPRRLRQVLSHLVGNALKFTEAGDVMLEVQRQDDQTLCFLVHDTGPGLAAEQQAGLFDALPVADQPDAHQHTRPGLGLPLARSLVSLMGGQIGVQSTPGEGASFWFTVPLVPASHTAWPGRLPKLPAHHVLVVDDNATSQALLAEHLAVFGMRCSVAGGAEQALTLLNEAIASDDPFELALIDTHMPGMDGLTLASHLRAQPMLQGLRLVLVTTRQSRDELARARQAGVAAYLSKPVRRHDLLRAVAQALADQGPDTDTPQTHTTAGEPGESGEFDDGLPLLHARMLLADAPGPQRQALQDLLQAMGCDFVTVADGAQALARLSLEHFDLALLAARLPDLDAADTARAVRQREHDTGRRRLPLVALTPELDATGQAQACRLAGVDDVLQGPVTAGQLAAVLTHWLPTELVEPAAPRARASATPTSPPRQALAA